MIRRRQMLAATAGILAAPAVSLETVEDLTNRIAALEKALTSG